MTDNEITLVSVIISLLIFAFVGSLFVTFLYRNVKERLGVLENQLVTLAGNVARFMISTNNLIADISTGFDCCDDNIDTLFDEKDEINESITELKSSVDCINCKLRNPYNSFYSGFFSKRRDKNG